MKKIISIFLFGGLIVFAFQSCGSNEGKPSTDSTNSNTKVSASVNGKSLYEEKCTMCHGDDGAAGTMGAADLSLSKLDHAAVVLMIKTGKNSMKAFSPDLNDAQIDAVTKYIETLRK